MRGGWGVCVAYVRACAHENACQETGRDGSGPTAGHVTWNGE